MPPAKRPRSPSQPPTQQQKETIEANWGIKIPKLKPMAAMTKDKMENEEAKKPAEDGTGKEAASSSSSPAMVQCLADDEPPRRYGYWMKPPGPVKDRPWALIMFSGPSREGDIQHALCRKGWRVCAIDTVAPRPTDLLCDATWESISLDLVGGFFKGLWMATPCETFSPLREKQPGPRVLRTIECVEGLPRSSLTLAEQKQLKESNILVKRTASAASAQTASGNMWGLENPDHGDEKPSLWLMPSIADVIERKANGDVRFDQCRTGLATRKPTRLVTKDMDFTDLQGLRCNHALQTFTRVDGSTYKAAHEPTVQRWTTNEQGQRERASKAQGHYTPQFSEAIARAFHSSQRGAPWLLGDLGREAIP